MKRENIIPERPKWLLEKIYVYAIFLHSISINVVNGDKSIKLRDKGTSNKMAIGFNMLWVYENGISCTSELGSLVITEIISEMDSSKSPTQGYEKTFPIRPAM